MSCERLPGCWLYNNFGEGIFEAREHIPAHVLQTQIAFKLKVSSEWREKD
jgi:hypothetical protein